MDKVYKVPLLYKQGVYGVSELEADGEVLELYYSDCGNIVEYELANRTYGRIIRAYNIPEESLDNTLRAVYDEKDCLKKIIVDIEGKDRLLYIHYENPEEAKQVLEKFAQENAKQILDKIGMCKDTVSRVFIEYFNDGECMDIHAKIGTQAEKEAVEEKYPDIENASDYSGDYSSETLEGDNDRLKVLVACANKEEFNYFLYVVDIIAKYIEAEAPKLLNQADDYKFLCSDYD